MSKTVIRAEWLVAGRRPGRAQNGDCFPIVPSIDAKVFFVHRDHCVAGKQFTEADQAQVSISLHVRANPLREERSGGALILPAWRRKRWLPASDLARSSWCRIIRLTGKLVCRRLSRSHSASRFCGSARTRLARRRRWANGSMPNRLQDCSGLPTMNFGC